MKKIVNSVTWKIGGEAGEGIMVTGLLFSKSCIRAGLRSFDYTEYPSLIRGGHNTYLTQVSEHEIFSHDRGVEILVALNQETIDKHIDELPIGGAIIYDPDDKKVHVQGKRQDLLYIPLEFGKIALEIAKNKLLRNTVALGASFGLLEFPTEIALQAIRDVFDGKKEEIVKANEETFLRGYQSITEDQKKKFGWKLEVREKKDQVLMTGNEAVALGAISAGCKFYAAYPMTPASSILSFLAEHGPKYEMVVKHAEDEISVVNMAIGAGHMGVRSMCATSGGGFALMNEGYGLAAITETPVVIGLVQRPGPATGLPTWTGQGDLKYALNAAQGEFPRFVVAPGDVEEAYYLTADAFNVAEEYQTPVLLLSDKHLAESHQTVPPFDQSRITISRGKVVDEKKLPEDNSFKRYDVSVDDGISPRSLPGMKHGVYVANSDEHNEHGYSEEDAEPVKAMIDKRERKFKAFKKIMPQPDLFGDPDADYTFVFWGSPKGAVKEAMIRLKDLGVSTNYLQLTWLSPFPEKRVAQILSAAKHPVLVENNMNGQLGELIREQTGIAIEDTILKYDGRPFFPEEIVEHLKI